MLCFKRNCYNRKLNIVLLHLLLLSLAFCEVVGFFQSIRNGISNGFQSLGDLYCSGFKCCEFHLRDDVVKHLAIQLNEKLFGQHIAKSIILEAVSSHRRNKPQKPLGIGLHGWTGTGKNYVSQMIAESLYKKGMHSPLVHVFAGRASFPSDEKVETYKRDLIGWIRGNVTMCPHTLFIFDECDKWPETLLNVVKPVLDYHSVIEGADYRNAIFLFITNSGGSAIGERMLQLHEKGVFRRHLKLEDFHNEISIALFNEKGGFYRADIVRGDGIDFHLPFLPLEERHIRKCAMHQFKLKGFSPSEEMIQYVLTNMQYGPESNPVFSMTGCKRVHALVISVIARMKLEL